MINYSREFAKFLSGIAFHETLGHWWLGLWGREMLPWKFSWFTFTSEMNTACMIAWPALFLALFWFAWLRNPGTQTRAATREEGPVIPIIRAAK